MLDAITLLPVLVGLLPVNLYDPLYTMPNLPAVAGVLPVKHSPPPSTLSLLPAAVGVLPVNITSSPYALLRLPAVVGIVLVQGDFHRKNPFDRAQLEFNGTELHALMAAICPMKRHSHGPTRTRNLFLTNTFE